MYRRDGLRGAHLLDVVGVLGLDGLIQLEIGEIEVDVLVGLPGAHQVVSPFVSAAEAHERSRKGCIAISWWQFARRARQASGIYSSLA